MSWFRGAGCGACRLVNPEFDIVALADRQTIQTDLTAATKKLWKWVVAEFPGQIELIGGVGDSAHAKRKSCHNVLRVNGIVAEGAKALDIQPIGIVGSAKFVKLGTKIVDAIWADRAVNGCTVQIWRGRIRSIYKANGAWRPYFAINRHNKHSHHSVNCAG